MLLMPLGGPCHGRITCPSPLRCWVWFPRCQRLSGQRTSHPLFPRRAATSRLASACLRRNAPTPQCSYDHSVMHGLAHVRQHRKHGAHRRSRPECESWLHGAQSSTLHDVFCRSTCSSGLTSGRHCLLDGSNKSGSVFRSRSKGHVNLGVASDWTAQAEAVVTARCAVATAAARRRQTFKRHNHCLLAKAARINLHAAAHVGVVDHLQFWRADVRHAAAATD